MLTEYIGEHRLTLPPELGIDTSEPLVWSYGYFEKDAVIARFPLNPPRPDVNMDLRVVYDVAFGDDGPASVTGIPVLQTLRDIRSEIRGRVLPSLRKFIPKG